MYIKNYLYLFIFKKYYTNFFNINNIIMNIIINPYIKKFIVIII